MQESIWEIDSNWDRIPFLEQHGENFELTDAIMQAQLQELVAQSKITRPDPAALSQAIALASYPDSHS